MSRPSNFRGRRLTYIVALDFILENNLLRKQTKSTQFFFLKKRGSEIETQDESSFREQAQFFEDAYLLENSYL